MQTHINYSKYEARTRRALFNSREREEKKLSSIQELLRQQSELISYLKAKVKSKIDEPKSYKLSEAPSIKKLDAEFEKLSQAEQEAIKAEVIAQMGADNV